MGIADIISITLGIISIWLALRYKKLGDKLDKDREQIIQLIHDKSVYSAVEVRHIYEAITATSNTINLHKDKLYVFKTSKYKSCNSSEVIDK